MLNSRYPIALYWGAELALLYNDAWSAIPGGKHPWALGRPGREVWPEIWGTIGPLFDTVRATGEGVWQEDELLPMLRHGYVEECYFNFTFSPVRGEDGTIDGIFNAVVETTDRVLSERRLRTLSRMGERTNFSLSAEAACAWATNILAENDADVPFALVYLREGDEARLASSTSLEPGSACAPNRLFLNSKEPQIWPLTAAMAQARALIIPSPAGTDLTSTYWSEPIAEVVVVPISSAAEERPTAFLVIGANPRRRVDATYRSFFELAAGHIGTALATARAYEDERRRAQALAEIDRAKTTFFSNISHEFRTPLTLMLGPLEEALTAAADASDQKVRLDLVHRNALRLLRLVNALLDFSRIEAGRVEATFQPTNLAALTADLASSFRAATEKAGVKLIVDTPQLPQPVYVDRDMWEKIVLNLVSNAFKFTLAGEIAIALREVDGSVVLSVRDTGVGIPVAELPKLFDRFYRVEGVKGRSFEGSGIGLALVHELVKLHGGTIGVDSKEGLGTTFTVAVPLGRAHLPPGRVRVAAEDGAAAIRPQAYLEEALRWLPNDESRNIVLDLGASRDSLHSNAGEDGATARNRVLLVDDNADLRDYIARLLVEAGYAVETVPDGERALTVLAERRPDLLITDVMMPELDGFGLLRKIRDRDELRDLPVIMLSARAGEEAKLEGLDAGVDDYLTKPFSARELLARTAANIKLARLRREAADAVRMSERKLRELNATLEQRVAEALAEKRLFADLIETTDAFVQAVDPEFRWLAINCAATDEFERIYGVRPKVGQSMLDVIAHMPEHQAAVRAVWSRALAGEEFTEVGEFGDRSRDRRFYEMKYYVLRGSAGERIGAYQFAYNVTDRIREQERLAQAEEQLRQAQKMEAVGQLTGGIAHDFNNLLQGVAGSLDLIRRKPGDREHVKRWAEAGFAAAERGSRLTAQLLAFSRAQKMELKPVALSDLVSEFREMIDRTIGAHIRIELDLTTDGVQVLGDEIQIEMAVLNLALNARDAMPDGGKLTISTRPVRLEADPNLANGDYVELAVRDTGVGMSPDVVARAFDPFFTTKSIGKGTGLGLSQVYEAMRQAGGSVRIESRPGEGTTVRLLLRRTDDLPFGSEADRSGAETDPFTAKVLVVDDDPDVRRFLSESLDALGLEVVEAEDGYAGLAALERSSPDLMIVDFAMPGLNGAELAKRVLEKRPDLPIVFATGFAESSAIEAVMGERSPILRKPFGVDDLQRVIACALGTTA
jgi:signal transduction histidine kinase/DNA-binding response OmpR family regulator